MQRPLRAQASCCAQRQGVRAAGTAACRRRQQRLTRLECLGQQLCPIPLALHGQQVLEDADLLERGEGLCGWVVRGGVRGSTGHGRTQRIEDAGWSGGKFSRRAWSAA